MSRDTNFTPGSTIPSAFLNEDQEADTGLVWGLSLGQASITPTAVTLKVPTVVAKPADAQVSAVLDGKKRWTTADSSATASGIAGARHLYLTGESGTTTLGITLTTDSATPSAAYYRRIGTAYYNGTTNLSGIRLQHGVQADADQFNAFVFRSIATNTGETPLTIAGYSAQANDSTKLLSLGSDVSSTYTERLYVTGKGLLGYELAAASDLIARSRVATDSVGQYRFTQDASGKMVFADAAGSNTATLERSANNTIKISNTLDVVTLTNSVGASVTIADGLDVQGDLSVSGAAFASTKLTDSAALARLASPTFTGTPLAPTAAADTNTTQIATTAFVIGQGYLKAGTATSTYAALASPAFTGTPTAPTAAVDTSTTQIATTAYVVGQGYAKLNSPTFTGTPSLPTGTTAVTQTPGDSSTKLATTAFVAAADALKANANNAALTGVPTAPTAANGTSTTQIATTAFVLGSITAASVGDATTSTKGAVLMSVAPAVASSPTAVGTNDPRVTADQAAGTASIRTLGTGAQQAAAGNHNHAISSLTGTIASAQYGGAIADTDISATAGIAFSKLAAVTAGQVLYGVGTALTAGSPDTAGLVDKSTTQTIGGAKTFSGATAFGSTSTFTGAATFNSTVGVNAAFTTTTGGYSSTLGGSDFTLRGSSQTGYLSSSGLAFGPAGSTDWSLTRTNIGLVELGTNNVIRDNRSAATIGSGNAKELVNREYVDAETAKIGTKLNNVTAATPGTAVTTAHDTVFVNYSGAVSIPLTSYSAVGNAGRKITFKDISGACSTINSITIDANGSETIDGALTYVMDTPYEAVTIQSNGTNWFVVA